MKSVCFIAPLVVCAAGLGYAQDVRVQPLYGTSGIPITLNQAARISKGYGDRATSPQGIVLTGDTVIPHIADGGSWRTTFMFVNLENHAVHFNLLFFTDGGYDFILPVTGQGNVRGMSVTLQPAGTAQFETAGTGSVTQSGWALMSQDNYNDSIGGMAVFRQVIAGRPDFEAVVPIVNRFQNHFALYYDNVGYTTAYAIANPSNVTVAVPLTLRDQNGVILQTKNLTLGPYNHTADTLVNLFPTTSGRRGVLEIQATGYGVGAMGLRFGGASFTSFPVLENYDWFVNQ